MLGFLGPQINHFGFGVVYMRFIHLLCEVYVYLVANCWLNGGIFLITTSDTATFFECPAIAEGDCRALGMIIYTDCRVELVLKFMY